MNTKRSWTENQLKVAVKNATSVRQVLGLLGLRQAGGNYAQMKKYINELQINIDHFTGPGWRKGKKGGGIPRLKLEEILINGSDFQSYKLKKRLFREKRKEAKCELCGWAESAPGGRIPLELDHINGNRRDNRLENLRVLCPNCHSLQPTHRALNKRKKMG